MASVRHLGLFPLPNNNFEGPCLNMVPEYYEGREKVWHQVTVEQAMRIYWRVKKWQIVVDAEYGGNPITEIEQYDPTEPLEQETDLVCKYNVAPYWQGAVAQGIGVDALFVASGDFGYNAPIVIRKDENGALFVALAATLTAGARTAISVALSDNLEFAFSWSGASDEDGNPYSGTATVKPLEYWEYDPGDGLGPIYDKTTGAQLR